MSDIDQRMKNAEESGAGAPENNGADESAEADAKKAAVGSAVSGPQAAPDEERGEKKAEDPGADHDEDHGGDDEEEEMDPKYKLIQIIVSTALLILAAVITKLNPDLAMWQKLLIFLVPYFAAGFDVLKEAGEGIGHGEVFNEDFLMVVATIGALLIGFVPGGSENFAEAVFVMLFFQVGELFEGIAEGNSSRAVSQLLDIRPDTANVERGGSVQVVNPADVRIGETVVIKPGEKVPMDGTVIEGKSSLNTVALTGESAPRDV
ncbi:MAG: hypothetical protein SPL54_05340, partial [Lachnospiraceae bacterium]|nr:hypothetical protein [Lachnospiraceae bacterium]